MLSRVIYGARISLFVGAFATLAGDGHRHASSASSRAISAAVVDRLITAAIDVLLASRS